MENSNNNETTTYQQTLIDNLLNKSQEAFLMSIEIYNKPTIKYRLEGFAFFICNAWELMLKAYLVKTKGPSYIYYKDKPGRTISLNDCLKQVFTNDKDPIRKNLEIIIDLRNTSTHFVIKELESIYLPFLQANTINYSQKIYDFFKIDITKKVETSFLSLITNTNELSDTEILSVYGNEIFSKYKKSKQEITSLLENEINNKLAINIDLNLKVVKNIKDADMTFAISKEAEDSAYIIDKVKDINTTYPYSQKQVRETTMSNLARKNIIVDLHQTNFALICDKFNLKDSEDYFYYHSISKRYGCSQKLVDFVTNLLTENPTLIDDLKLENKNNKLTPGAKDS